jgi:hypothetical protein
MVVMQQILAQIALCATAVCVGACSSQQEKRIEEIEAEVAMLEADVSSCQIARDSASRHDGEQALAEWDEAAANVVDDVSPDAK